VKQFGKYFHEPNFFGLNLILIGEPLYYIVEQTFGVLGGIVNQVIAVEAELAYEVLYLIAKIFYLSNQLYITPYLS